MVYLDYAATAPYVKYLSSAYGPFLNPNANYAYKEKRLLEQAENRTKKSIGAKSGKVVFGGTSSQLIENLVMAIRLRMDKKTEEDYQFYYSRYEHDSIERFNNWGSFYVDSLVDIEQEAKECRKECVTPFVFWQGASNITGEIFPVTEIGNACHEHDAFYICDATAMIGHTAIPENIDKWCDAFIMDGHKLGTELGIGAMWISDNLDRWLDGFKLHGTPNLTGALAMTQAVEDVCDSHTLGERTIFYNEMQGYLIGYLVGADIDFTFVPEYDEQPSGHEFTSAINAIRLPGIQAEALQQFLASKQIYVGVGHSSCSNNTRVLNAYGLSNEEAHEVIRVSFGDDVRNEDIKALVEGIKEFKNVYC